MLNNNGERGQPCLTPELIFIFLVVLPLLLMIVTLSLYISNIPSITSSGIPFLVIPFVIDLCDTVSKVFAKSKKTMLYSFLHFLCCLMICCRIFTFWKQPSTGTKPFCLSSNFTLALNLLSQILAYSLINIFPIVVGRQFPNFSRSSLVFGSSFVMHSLALSGILFPHHLFSMSII